VRRVRTIVTIGRGKRKNKVEQRMTTRMCCRLSKICGCKAQAKAVRIRQLGIKGAIEEELVPEISLFVTYKDKYLGEPTHDRHVLVPPRYGDITYESAYAVMSEFIADLVQRRIHGIEEEIDLDKLAECIVLDQMWRIDEAVYTERKHKVFVLLDFSGSCSWISKSFLNLGKAVVDHDMVDVFWGAWEGHVQGQITPETDLTKIMADYSGITVDSVSLGEYLYRHSEYYTIVIFGDYDGTTRYVKAADMHQHLPFLWFNTEQRISLSNVPKRYDVTPQRNITMVYCKDEKQLIQRIVTILSEESLWS